MSVYKILLDKNFDVWLNMPHHPLYLMFGLVIISFILEDVAVIAGVALSTAGSLSWSQSFLAVFFGIAFGDVLLYLAGFYSRKVPYLKNRFVDKFLSGESTSQQKNLAGTIFISRVIPGLRLVSYVYLGFKKVNIYRFVSWVMVAVLIWTASLFIGSIYLGEVLSKSLPIPKTVAVALPLLTIGIFTFVFSWLKTQLKKHS